MPPSLSSVQGSRVCFGQIFWEAEAVGTLVQELEQELVQELEQELEQANCKKQDWAERGGVAVTVTLLTRCCLWAVPRKSCDWHRAAPFGPGQSEKRGLP